MLGILDKAMFMAGGGGDRLVGFSNSTLNAQQATVSVAAVPRVRSGDLLIALMSCRGPTTWTGDTGWTEAFDNAAIAPSLRIAWKVATGSEPSSYTFTVASAAFRPVAQILAFRGMVWDTIGEFAGNAGASMTASSITSAGGILISLFASISTIVPGGNTFTTPVGMKAIPRATNEPPTGEMMSLQSFYQKVPAGATGTRASTIGGTTNGGNCILIGIKRP